VRAFVIALQLFSFTAVLLGPASPVTQAAGDALVELGFSTTHIDERPSDESAILVNINAARHATGVAPLALDERLCGIALNHARDMLLHKYISHTTPDGESPYDRMRAAGYAFSYAGENIALNADRGSAERALMASEAHRWNILERHYGHIGIAALVANVTQVLIVEVFSD
jgi:uncharacterized protein YkwD